MSSKEKLKSLKIIETSTITTTTTKTTQIKQPKTAKAATPSEINQESHDSKCERISVKLNAMGEEDSESIKSSESYLRRLEDGDYDLSVLQLDPIDRVVCRVAGKFYLIIKFPF